MQTYIVLYREPYSAPLDAPFGFRCEAEDGDHAEEQCVNAYPECDVLWLAEGDSYAAALDDYWCVSDFNRETAPCATK